MVLVLALTSLLPTAIMGLRWASYFGDNSPLGIFIATSMFHVIHGLFFLICLWVALDAPISPRIMGFGLAFLPFYYLGALAIGYFAGYFLLIFGTRATRSKSTLHPLHRMLNLLVMICLTALMVAVPVILVGKNLAQINSTKAVVKGIETYFAAIAKALPPQGAVVLSDDPSNPYPFRLEYLDATLRRGGKSSPHLLVSTASLTHDTNYLTFLKRWNPSYQLAPAGTNLIDGEPDALNIIHLLDRWSQTHPLYYIHPSFGYFFERFYAEPQGLVYQLKTYPTNALGRAVADSGPDQLESAFLETGIHRCIAAVDRHTA